MEVFTVTKEMMKNAAAYMPIALKETLAKQIAGLCVSKAPEDTSGLTAESAGLKQVLCLNAFLQFYLKAETVTEGEQTNIMAAFDEKACTNPINQVERYKGDPECKRMAFDMLSDYRDFKKIVNTEINNLLARNNDPYARLAKMLKDLLKDEDVKQMLSALSDQTQSQQTEKEEQNG